MILRIRPKVKIKFHFFYKNSRFLANSFKFDSNLIENDSFNEKVDASNVKLLNSSILPDFLTVLDHDQIKVKNYVKSKMRINGVVDYVDKLSDRCLIEESTSIPLKGPISSFQDILLESITTPSIGSLIEFEDSLTNKLHFGVVTRDVESRFNEHYNKLIVLTIKNELVQVPVPKVRLHFNQVIDKDYLINLSIMENRFNEEFTSRLDLVKFLQTFVKTSNYYSKLISNQFDIIYTQNSLQFNISSISSVEIIDLLVLPEFIIHKLNESYFSQCSLLLAIHHCLIDSTKFMAPSSNFGATNIVSNNCSNHLPLPCTYIINSGRNSQAIDKLLNDFTSERLVAQTNTFFNQLMENQQNSSSQKSYENLNYYFNIWEGRHYKHIIDIIKFMIIYPHFKVLAALQKIDIIRNSDDLVLVLENLKIYNNKSNPITDTYLSANILGEISLGNLVASSHKDIMPSETGQTITLLDKFPHLRKRRRYYNDHVIYGIPYSKSLTDLDTTTSFLAISLEKINSRRYSLNIHIPDIMTKLPPNSELFHSIINDNFKAIYNQIDHASLNSFFSSKLLKTVGFFDQGTERNDFVRVGDMSLENESPVRNHYGDSTCLTLSLIYDTYDSNPFAKLPEKVSFSFDSLSSVKIKNIDWKELNDCLEGKLEPSPFRLFRRVPQDEIIKTKLNDKDSHNIRFIDSVMNSHFKIRNHHGASIMKNEFDITDNTNLRKEVEYKNPTTTVTSIKKNETNYPKAQLFLKELEDFIGNSTSSFCHQHNIPMFIHSQHVFQNPTTEAISISHNNVMLPRYHASEYSHTLYSRDTSGNVSIPASIIGKSFLTKPTVGVYCDANVPKGMQYGYVKMLNFNQDCEVLLNQLQILNHVQSLAFDYYSLNSESHMDVVKKFSYLKSYGYNINKVISAEILSNQLIKVQNSENVRQYLSSGMKRYWTLKMMEQRLLDKYTSVQEATTNYDCTITYIGEKVDDLNLTMCSAYCEVLGLEIQVAVDSEEHFTIGTSIVCDKVIYLNPVSGHCIFKQAYTL